ncbi:MAG: DUF6282 family protein [Syntrophaceae bacterium]|nr:DUF6282 family protein [Syntrophaceae bacterium]
MNIDQMMSGAVDLHVHCGPDPFTERRVHANQLAVEAKQAGMRAVVIKNHAFSTALLAQLVNEINGTPILAGSIALNSSVGGLNPDVVEASAHAGAKVIWLPTLSAMEEIRVNPHAANHSPTNANQTQNPAGIDFLDSKGCLVPEIFPILEIIKRYNLALATGHLSIPEVFAVAAAALEKKIDVIITHPFAKPFGDSIKVEQARELVRKGAVIEFCFLACMPPMRITPEEVIGMIRTLGAENCVLSTDLGQAFNPPPAEGFRMMIANMFRFGMTEKELEALVKINPARLLRLG